MEKENKAQREENKMANTAREAHLQQQKAEEDLRRVQAASAALRVREERLQAREDALGDREALAAEARRSAALQKEVEELKAAAKEEAFLRNLMLQKAWEAYRALREGISEGLWLKVPPFPEP